MAEQSAYKIKKGETLDQVAKSHKLQVDEIWKYGPNYKLVAKRRTPDKCEPGDVVELPMSKADKQAALAKVEDALKALKDRATYIAAADKRLDALLPDLESKHKEWASGLDKLAKGVKSDGDKADMASMLLGFAASAGSFVKGARDVEKLFALKAQGVADAAAKIEALNHGMAVSAIESLYGPFSPAASATATMLSESRTSDNAFVSAIGTGADWFSQLTSPSGWAKFITGVDKDMAEARRLVDDNYAKMKNQILRKKGALQTELKSVESTRDILGRAYQNMKKG